MRHLGLIIAFAGACMIATAPAINGFWMLGVCSTLAGIRLLAAPSGAPINRSGAPCAHRQETN